MALTFKSTGQEVKVLIDREPSGRQRIARATQSEHNARFWNLTVEHPSGEKWPGTFHGDSTEAMLALVDMLDRTKMDYIRDRANGDRPRAPARDNSMPVLDGSEGQAQIFGSITKRF
jgi:hypothetical protein